MIKLLLLCLIFLVSCTTNNTRNNFNFSDQMSFEEFRIKLDEYAINNPYPNIDG
tara:strand:+ start:397 stop:558 length:162 start_codon:yes stop_codon:yes gene_type:complete